MLGWLKTIIGSGASTIIDSVGSAIDKCVTSTEEKLILKNELEAIVSANKLAMEKEAHDYEIELERNITERWKADAESDSWLSRSIRPLVLGFLTISVVILAYCSIFVLTPDEIVLVTPWIALFQTILMVVYVAFFGSRGIEKVASIKAKK